MKYVLAILLLSTPSSNSGAISEILQFQDLKACELMAKKTYDFYQNHSANVVVQCLATKQGERDGTVWGGK